MTSTGVSRAQENRAIRREALREQLSAQGHVQYVVDNIQKLSDFEIEMDSLQVQRLKIANDGHLKLIAKYLPDGKTLEVTTETVDRNENLTLDELDAKITRLIETREERQAVTH